MIKYCIFSIFCFLPFLIWSDELPQLGKAPLEKVIQAGPQFIEVADP